MRDRSRAKSVWVATRRCSHQTQKLHPTCPPIRRLVLPPRSHRHAIWVAPGPPICRLMLPPNTGNCAPQARQSAASCCHQTQEIARPRPANLPPHVATVTRFSAPLVRQIAASCCHRDHTGTRFSAALPRRSAGLCWSRIASGNGCQMLNKTLLFSTNLPPQPFACDGMQPPSAYTVANALLPGTKSDRKLPQSVGMIPVRFARPGITPTIRLRL